MTGVPKTPAEETEEIITRFRKRIEEAVKADKTPPGPLEETLMSIFECLVFERQHRQEVAVALASLASRVEKLEEAAK